MAVSFDEMLAANSDVVSAEVLAEDAVAVPAGVSDAILETPFKA